MRVRTSAAVEPAVEEAGGCRPRRTLRVVQTHRATGAGESDCPCSADETTAENRGDLWVCRHQSVSTFPQTLSDWPEIFRPAGEHRKSTMSATSCAVTIRRNETLPRNSLSIVA